MQDFVIGLFDRLDQETEAPSCNRHAARARALDEAMRSVTRDLQALLNTRSALAPKALAPYPALSSSVVNYGLVDFAAMCISSHIDQQQICAAVQKAIEHHEPRLHGVTVALCPSAHAINRIDFVITARLRGSSEEEPVAFSAVFRPSLQKYAIEERR